MDTLSILDVRALVDMDEIAELDAKVIASNLIHLNLALLDIIGAQADQNGISSLLASSKRTRREYTSLRR